MKSVIVVAVVAAVAMSSCTSAPVVKPEDVPEANAVPVAAAMPRVEATQMATYVAIAEFATSSTQGAVAALEGDVVRHASHPGGGPYHPVVAELVPGTPTEALTAVTEAKRAARDEVPSPFEPWRTVEIYPGDTVAFCSGLNAARADNDRPAFASCEETAARMEHAMDMATTGTVYHSGDSIVGGGKSISDLVSKFMASPSHRAGILSEAQYAEVGCYVRETKGQVAEDPSTYYEFSSVFCTARLVH